MRIPLELNSQGLYLMLRKLQNHFLVYKSCVVVVVQRRPRNVQKSVMHVQSCYFANQNLLFFYVLVVVA